MIEFTYEEEEITKYARCIAMPLRVNNQIVAALSISFIVFDATPEHITNIKYILRRFGTVIAKLMELKTSNTNSIEVLIHKKVPYHNRTQS